MPDLPLQHSGSYMGSLLSQPSSAPLKRTRAASAPCESEEARQRKRSRGSADNSLMNEKITEDEEEELGDGVGCLPKNKGKENALLRAENHSVLGGTTVAVIEDLAQELKCGCCTELCYNPVIVNPCQHFFCGSCCILWVRNGGTNCPACRGISTTVTPSRVLQSMIDLLLRADPSKGRTDNERAQADQVYRAGTALRLPTPRPVTPEPNLEPANDNFARPCPTCLPGNAYGWRCPIPIVDPAVDQENAFDLDDGTPIGHTFCGNCDQLHNIQAPTSTKCDFCQVSFCGVGIQSRCCAIGLLSQQPQGMTDLPDLILNGTIYDCFQRNAVEVDILVDYLRTNEITLRGVYKEIIAHTLQQPNTFSPLIDSGIFDDLHPVSGGDDLDPSSPRRRICRLCAAQVLIHGFKDWWIRERKQGNLPVEVSMRTDCAQGNTCDKQNDPAHAREFNHIIHTPAPAPANALPVPEPSLNVPPSPPSDSPAPIPANQQQVPAFELFDIEMPPPQDQLPQSTAGVPEVVPHPSSQLEVEAMTNSRHAEGSSNMGSISMELIFAPNTPPWAYQRSRTPPLAEDVVMTGDNEENGKRDDGTHAQQENAVVEAEGGEEKIELMGPKTPSSSRAHLLAFSNSPEV